MPCSLSLDQLAEAVNGKVISKNLDSFTGVNTDTRVPVKNALFIALKGDNFDGHDHLTAAIKSGAVVLLVDHETDQTKALNGKVSIVLVSNTLKALQALARYWRKKLSGKIVGITGSNGKSTAKEFTYAILKEQFITSVSHKSFNNHIGVPLTLLSANLEDEVIIVEMGMNHAGELEKLSKIVMPDIVLCTMVGRGHIGNFKDLQQGVADAKEEIYLSNPEALMIFNYDNEFTLKMFERISKLKGTDNTRVFSSFAAGAEISLRATHLYIDSIQVTGHIGGVKGEARVPSFGRQNVVNLMAAASIAFALGMEPEAIWLRLSHCKSGWGRNQIVHLENGTTVFFDAYNANPDSMAILVKNLFELVLEGAGRKIFVLGEMLELGPETKKAHVELGELVANTDAEIVCFIGPSAKDFEAGLKNSGFSKKYVISDTYEDSLALKIQSMLQPSDIVAMKASRGMRLERMLKAWKPDFDA